MRVFAFCVVACTALAQAPDPEQLFHDAVTAQQRGDDETAIRKYRQLLKIRPDVVEVRANLGAALAKEGRYDEAIQEYRAALAKNGANATLRFNLALAYYKKGALSDAAKELELVRSEPVDPRVGTLLGDCYARLGQDGKAITLLSPVAATHPDDLGVAWILGSAMIRAGQTREGLALVERVARNGNSAEAYLLAGQTLLKMSEFERARDDADAALRLNPQLPHALTLRGTVLTYLGDNQGAIETLKKALETDPKDFDAQLALGSVLHTERDLAGAREHLQQALRLNPESNLALYEMARLERTEGKLDQSAKDFEKVIRDNPKWPQPHLELSALYFRLNRQTDGERERAEYERLSGSPSR
jgi:tetratricopeptide (TPR) repeat protein